MNRGADFVQYLVQSPLAPESGSRGVFSPSPHNTLHAGPHRAFNQVRPEVSDITVNKHNLTCRITGSFLPRHALLVTVLCEARGTMKPLVERPEEPPATRREPGRNRVK